jgi:hypothetical protein
MAMLSDRERSPARSGWTAGMRCGLRAVGHSAAAAGRDVPRAQPFGRPVRLKREGTSFRQTLMTRGGLREALLQDDLAYLAHSRPKGKWCCGWRLATALHDAGATSLTPRVSDGFF